MRGRPVTVSDEVLLDAARDVLLAQGPGATTAAIATRAGVSEGALFYRFKTKDDLLAAVLKREIGLPSGIEKLEQRVGNGDIAEHLFEVGQGILDATKRTLPLLMIARSGAAWKVDALRDRMKRPHPTQVKTLRLLARYFEGEMRQGRLREIDSEIVARLFFGGVLQFAMMQLWFEDAERLPLPFPMYMRGLVDSLLHGIAARRRR